MATASTDPEISHESFVFFWGKGTPFTQFHPCIFVVDGQEYSSAEQYMMHQKAVVFKDDHVAKKILGNYDPKKIKALGREVKDFDDDVWNQHCVEVVKNGNRHKFSQNPDLKATLFATKGKLLVEASPRDRKWGIGLGAKNPLAWKKETWKGQNLLGYALTEVRDELMKEEGLL